MARVACDAAICIILYMIIPNGLQMQVFHVCWEKRQAAFLCPEGTLFNQLVQVCDWWYNVDCETSFAEGKKS